MKNRCMFVAALCSAAWLGARADDPESKILTYKQYAKIRHETPYVLEFEVGKGALLLYGSRHVFDPENPFVADIEREWEKFKPDVAYNEGGNPPSARAKKDAVERYGEPGLVRHLAARDAVPVATYEPKEEDEIQFLLKSYSPEQVKMWFTLRGFMTFRQTKQERTADQHMNGILGNPGWKAAGMDAVVTNVDELQAACDRLFTEKKKWKEIPDSWFDPTKDHQFTNAIQNESGLFRDKHIFKVLTKRAQRGDRVFAVIGASHVPVLEQALVDVLGKPARKREGMAKDE